MEKLKIHLIICPTLREKNGLAMSSRNLRLSVQQKQEAGAIYATLLLINQKIKPGLLDKLKKDGEKYLIKNNIRPDYVEIADAADLKQVTEWNGRDKLVAVIAAFVGEVRLIDNMLLKDQRDSIRNL